MRPSLPGLGSSILGANPHTGLVSHPSITPGPLEIINRDAHPLPQCTEPPIHTPMAGGCVPDIRPFRDPSISSSSDRDERRGTCTSCCSLAAVAADTRLHGAVRFQGIMLFALLGACASQVTVRCVRCSCADMMMTRYVSSIPLQTPSCPSDAIMCRSCARDARYPKDPLVAQVRINVYLVRTSDNATLVPHAYQDGSLSITVASPRSKIQKRPPFPRPRPGSRWLVCGQATYSILTFSTLISSVLFPLTLGLSTVAIASSRKNQLPFIIQFPACPHTAAAFSHSLMAQESAC